MSEREWQIELSEHSSECDGVGREKPVWPTSTAGDQARTQDSILDRTLDQLLRCAGKVGNFARGQVGGCAHYSSLVRDEHTAWRADCKASSSYLETRSGWIM